MTNEGNDKLLREKINMIDPLSGGIVFGKEEAWGRLQQRMEHKPAKRIKLYYQMAAVAATLVQFICSLFIIVGLFTRINALLLFGALSGAILQNLLAGRDPQLAILYTLVVLTLAFIGGGRISLDAKLFAKADQSPSRNAGIRRELKSI